jgi:hypothetical protein
MTYEPRAYTGLTEGYNIGRRRPGTEAFFAQWQYWSGRKIRHLGSWGIRPNHSAPTVQSVHRTGRAIDIGYGAEGLYTRTQMAEQIKILVEYAPDFGIELIVDYWPTPGGRTWRCDRGTWIQQPRGQIKGAPGGRWIHVELDPAHADDPKLISAAWHRILSGIPAPAPNP